MCICLCVHPRALHFWVCFNSKPGTTARPSGNTTNHVESAINRSRLPALPVLAAFSLQSYVNLADISHIPAAYTNIIIIILSTPTVHGSQLTIAGRPVKAGVLLPKYFLPLFVTLITFVNPVLLPLHVCTYWWFTGVQDCAIVTVTQPLLHFLRTLSLHLPLPTPHRSTGSLTQNLHSMSTHLVVRQLG